MEKRPLVIGNWKMELSYKAELELLKAIKDSLSGKPGPSEVVVCPSFVTLAAAKDELGKSKRIALGAQNVFWEEKGAWTGQVSLNHIKPFVDWCIVGHSEVRQITGIPEAAVSQLAKLLVRNNIRPVVCIGETREERDNEQTIHKIRNQIETLLSILDRAALVKAAIAYEPIWAIGSGDMPEPDDVAQVILLIRRHIAQQHGQEFAQRVAILYGGSVKPGTVGSYVGGPLADGVLVGGASVHPHDFVAIIKEVEIAFGA